MNQKNEGGDEPEWKKKQRESKLTNMLIDDIMHTYDGEAIGPA